MSNSFRRTFCQAFESTRAGGMAVLFSYRRTGSRLVPKARDGNPAFLSRLPIFAGRNSRIMDVVSV